MSSATLPWNIDDVLPPACEQLFWGAKTPDAITNLTAGDVLLWQRVSDRAPQPLEFVVVWLHFLLPSDERAWALVQLQKWNGEKRWTGEDTVGDDVRDYVAAIAKTDFGTGDAIQNGFSRYCRCYDVAPTNDDIAEFLELCAFFSPWVDGVQEDGDSIEDRIINWTAWMKHLGWEPAPRIVRQLGKHRAV